MYKYCIVVIHCKNRISSKELQKANLKSKSLFRSSLDLNKVLISVLIVSYLITIFWNAFISKHVSNELFHYNKKSPIILLSTGHNGVRPSSELFNINLETFLNDISEKLQWKVLSNSKRQWSNSNKVKIGFISEIRKLAFGECSIKMKRMQNLRHF